MASFYFQLLNTPAAALFLGLGGIVSAGRLFGRTRAERFFVFLSVFLVAAGITKLFYHSLPDLCHWRQYPLFNFSYAGAFALAGVIISWFGYRKGIARPGLISVITVSCVLEAAVALSQDIWILLLQIILMTAACLLAFGMFFQFSGVRLRSRAGMLFFIFLSMAACVFLARMEANHLQDELSDEYASLKTYQKMLYDLESRGKAEIKLLAVQPEIAGLFTRPDRSDFMLASWAKILGASAIYGMDRSGEVIFSSSPEFMGNNYGFRPYFKKALNGRANVFLGRGVTTGIEGIYFARPVIKDMDILGVLVVKQDMDGILGPDFKRSGILLMINPGIILYGPDRFAGGFLGRMTPSLLSYLNREKILGKAHLRHLGLKAIGDSLFEFPDAGLYKLVSLPIYRQAVEVARFYPMKEHLFYRFELVLLFFIFSLIYFLLLLKFIHNRAFISRLKYEIDHRKRAERELKLLAAAVEQASEAIMITDSRGRIEYVNSAFSSVTGYSSEEVQGKSPSILKSGSHNSQFYARLWETITKGGVWRGRFINRKKDGSLLQDETTIFPVKEDDGEIIRFVAVKRDLTREAHLEAQLLQAQKMESIGILAGGIAHDFNNILAGIQVNLDLMRSRRQDPGAVAIHLQKIQYGVSRASDLVKQLLLFSRRNTLRLSSVDLNQCVAGMSKMIQGVLGEKIILKLKMEDSLWLIKADAGAVDQIILNLAINARDAMLDGGVLTIKTANMSVKEERNGLQAGRYVVLSVSDTGVGMDQETLQHIFDPFFTTKEVGRGTGLGLSVVYGMVKQFDGTLQVKSRRGKGATFEIYFPASLAAPLFLDGHEKERRDAGGTGERILLVEDEDMVRSVIAEALQENNYHVLKVCDERKAMEFLRSRRHEFHMVIMDAVSAERNGWELWKEVNSRRPPMPALLITGKGEPELARSRVKADNFHVIKKPFRISELLMGVRETLGGKSVRGAVRE